MSNKMSMVALDKYEKRLSIPVRVFVKYEARAKATGRSVAEEMIIELSRAVESVDFTPDLKARFDELYDANLAKRRQSKERNQVMLDVKLFFSLETWVKIEARAKLEGTTPEALATFILSNGVGLIPATDAE